MPKTQKDQLSLAIIDIKILYFQVIPDPGQSDNESGQWKILKIVERKFENAPKMKVESFEKFKKFISCKICFFCFEYNFRLSSVLYGHCSGTLCVIVPACSSCWPDTTLVLVIFVNLWKL